MRKLVIDFPIFELQGLMARRHRKKRRRRRQTSSTSSSSTSSTSSSTSIDTTSDDSSSDDTTSDSSGGDNEHYLQRVISSQASIAIDEEEDKRKRRHEKIPCMCMLCKGRISQKQLVAESHIGNHGLFDPIKMKVSTLCICLPSTFHCNSMSGCKNSSHLGLVVIDF
jgi:hypothetical protein